MSTTIGFAGEAPPGEGVEMAKGPRDEDDPNQLRRFAKRIAEMKWWNNHSNSDKPEATPGSGQTVWFLGSPRCRAMISRRRRGTSSSRRVTISHHPKVKRGRSTRTKPLLQHRMRDVVAIARALLVGVARAHQVAAVIGEKSPERKDGERDCLSLRVTARCYGLPLFLFVGAEGANENSTVISRLKNDVTNKPFRRPVKTCFAAYLAHRLFDEATAKAFAFRHFYPGAVQFGPAERQSSILGARPRQFNLAFRQVPSPHGAAPV